MFWEPQWIALPEHCVLCLVKRTLRRPQRDFIRKSAAALSRFMNEYGWPTRAVIRATRKQVLKELLKYAPRGKRPHLQVIIDLTTLEKRGKFKAVAKLIHILNGKLEKRFVISTRVLKGSTISWWGRRRWAIEGFFKTTKDQFGLASFGQQKLIGVYRWLILSFISFVLTHCWAGDPPSRVYLSLQRITLPDWKEAALQTLHQLLPKTAVNLLRIEVESKRELLASGGAALS